MKHTLQRFLSLLCALSLCLAPLCAHAEEKTPAELMTFTIENFSGTVDGADVSLPLSLRLTAGADLAALRAFFMLALNSGQQSAAAALSIENGEVRAALSDMETGLVMSIEEAAKAAISLFLLGGLDFDSVSEELRAAAAEYTRLLYDSWLQSGEAIVSDNLLDAFYPADVWADEHANYPSLLNAVYAGEEEITLFGQTYTAKKYAYSLNRATAEEYSAFFAAYDEYYAESDALEDAGYLLEDLTAKEWDALLYGADDSSAWTDDGSAALHSGGSLSEWNEYSEESVFYSLEGFIWQVDEIMGTLDQCRLTTHYSDGDSVQENVYSDMRTGTSVRIETSSELTDSAWPEYRSALAQTTVVSLNEAGELAFETQSFSSEEDEDYSVSSEESTRLEITESGLTADAKTTAFYGGSDYAGTPYAAAPQQSSVHADLIFSPDGEDNLYGALSGPIHVFIDTSDLSADLSFDTFLQISPFPEGELLPAPEKSINPFDADSATQQAFLEELQQKLFQLFGGLMSAPETPSSVGGALLS